MGEVTEVVEALELEEDGVDFTKPWDHSDVMFVVEGQKVYANKMILSMCHCLHMSLPHGS